jgi:hypothetical protein
VRRELQAIDENAGDDRVAKRARVAHEFDMPGVQVAHRRYEGDAPGHREALSQFRGGREDLQVRPARRQ